MTSWTGYLPATERTERLSVEASGDTVDAFRRQLARTDVTEQEGMRRAVGLWAVTEQRIAAGHTLATLDHRGRIHRVPVHKPSLAVTWRDPVFRSGLAVGILAAAVAALLIGMIW